MLAVMGVVAMGGICLCFAGGMAKAAKIKARVWEVGEVVWGCLAVDAGGGCRRRLQR